MAMCIMTDRQVMAHKASIASIGSQSRIIDANKRFVTLLHRWCYNIKETKHYECKKYRQTYTVTTKISLTIT